MAFKETLSSVTLCILNSPIWGWPSEGKLSGSPTHSFCSSLSFVCKGPLLFFERTKVSPATGDRWTLPSNEAIGFKQQQAVNQIPFSEEAQREGVPEWKERKQGSRKGLLKRCILSNLAIRKLNLLNKHRVFLTYIDVPEFLLQVSMGNGEEKEIELDKNYQIPQKNIRLFIHRTLAANNC